MAAELDEQVASFRNRPLGDSSAAWDGLLADLVARGLTGVWLVT